MSSPSRSKQAIRPAKNAKTGRRSVRSTTGVPIMPIVVGGILLVVFVGVLIYGIINSRPHPVPTVHGSTGDIPCDALEHTQVHYHVGIQVVLKGTNETQFLTQGAGIQGGEATPSCYYWLHVHASDANTIHIESPADRTFTLGDFFKVWDTWSTYNNNPHELLSATQVGQYKVQTGDDVKVYVDLNDGKGPQLYQGDPNAIVLKSHEVITIVIGPPDLQPSDGRFPQFSFASGL